MRQLARATLLVLLLASISIGQESPDPFLLERLLPQDALVYLSLPQSAAASEDYRKSNLSRLWNHEEVRSFLAPIEAWWKKRKTQPVANQPSWNDVVKQEVGLSIDELWDLLQGPLSFAAYDVPLTEQHKLDLVLSLGAPDAGKLQKAANSLKATLKQQGGFAESEFKHGSATVFELASGEFHLFYALVEKTLVFTTLQERVEKILDAAGDKTFSGLRDDAKFKAARARVAPENRHFFLGYVNLAGILKQFRRELGDEMLQVLGKLGVADMTSLAAALAYNGPFIRERYAILTAQQTRGIVRFLSGGTPEGPQAALVPSGALSYGHLGLNLAEAYDVFLECAKVSPTFDQELAQVLKDYETRAGLNVREALATIGASWTYYSTLPKAGGVFPDDVYVVSLADPAKFEAALGKVAKAGGLPVDEMTFRGQRIRTLTIAFPEQPANPFDPTGVLTMLRFGYSFAWLIKDKQLYFSTNPLALKRQILRQGEKAATIADDPRYKALAARIPAKDRESWVYMDLGRTLNIVYSLLEPFLHLVRDLPRDPQTGDLIVDFARLPLGETLAELIGGALTHKHTLPDAIIVDSFSNPGVSTTSAVAFVGALGAVAVPLFMVRRGPAVFEEAGGIATNERVAEVTMVFIRQAEETFKNSDSDRNGVADYWTRDVAGLYGLKDRSGQAIFLLDPGTAGADPESAGRYSLALAPKNGYYFRMMLTDPDGDAYQKEKDKEGNATTNKRRFGAVAYPARYGATGRFTFITSEEGKVWKKDTGGQAVTKWPGKDPSKDGWTSVD